MTNESSVKEAISEQKAKLLQDVLDQAMAHRGVRHAVIAVESRDGSLAWAGARGIARPDGTPMETDTPFWIASVTKLYIASCILILHETGELSIEDAVIDYLPESLLKGLHVVDGVDYYDKLTIRHLLTHSSGIPDYLELKEKGQQTIVDRVIEGEDMSWTIEYVLDIVRAVNSPLFAPQNTADAKYRVRYSDTNFQLLIAIIEAATKKSLEDAFRDMLLKPLNLFSTFHPGSKPLKPSQAAATVWAQDTTFEEKPQALRSFGDLNSTAKDLIGFMRALYSGQVFAKPETLDLMMGSWQTFGVAFNPISPGWPIQYGLGAMRYRIPRAFTPFKPVPEVVGHTGAVGSWLFYCPKLDMIFTGTVSQITAAAVPFRVIPRLLQIMEE